MQKNSTTPANGKAFAARPRCRIGDLAIVTRCSVPERIGLLVRVVDRAAAPHDWVVELEGRGIMAWDENSGRMRLCRKLLSYEWNLTPIRGEEPLDVVETECVAEVQQ